MRRQVLTPVGWGAALLLAAVGLPGCSAPLVAGVGGTDSSSAFSAFSRPQRPNDMVPASLWTPPDTTPTVPDVHTDRRVAVSADLAVYVVHTELDILCMVVQELPGQASGGQLCSPGPDVIAQGMVMGSGSNTSDATRDRTAVLIPDGYTATITKGTFVLSGQGVLVAQGDGVEVTLTNGAGRTLHLATPARSQR